MTKDSTSLISTLVNFILATLKLAVGFLVHSAALIADGIHSGLDIASSLVTFLGIKIAKKPEDAKHPYGHLRAETVAGFLVALLLLASAIWIIYEGAISIKQGTAPRLGILAIVVVIFSIAVNQLMALLKFKIGKKTNSLPLIGDAKHSQADSISSVAVLVGLIVTHWFSPADALAAILVGLYIFYEAIKLSREVTDNLLDIADPAIEKKIRKICQEQEINLLDLKTRKIGPQISAQLKIGLNENWRMPKVQEVTQALENLLIKEIEPLQFVSIEVLSHQLKQGYLKSSLGQIRRFVETHSYVSLQKLGQRTIMPVDEKTNNLYPTFGAPFYLVIDKDPQGKVLQKKKIKNPYFVIGRGHGLRFIREMEPDIVITKEIGDPAKKALKDTGIKVKIVE